MIRFLSIFLDTSAVDQSLHADAVLATDKNNRNRTEISPW